jgi:hypothetical protein
MQTDALQPDRDYEFLHTRAHLVGRVVGTVRLAEDQAVILILGGVEPLVVVLLAAVVCQDGKSRLRRHEQSRLT